MTLGDLIVNNDQLDNILMDEVALDKFLESDDKITELINILIDQINNRVSESILLIDNYITVDNEEMSILEAQVRKIYLGIMVSKAGKLGLADKFTQLIDHVTRLESEITKAIYSIEVPEVSEEVVTD